MKSFFMTVTQLLFVLVMYAMGAIVFGAALIPSIALVMDV